MRCLPPRKSLRNPAPAAVRAVASPSGGPWRASRPIQGVPYGGRGRSRPIEPFAQILQNPSSACDITHRRGVLSCSSQPWLSLLQLILSGTPPSAAICALLAWLSSEQAEMLGLPHVPRQAHLRSPCRLPVLHSPPEAHAGKAPFRPDDVVLDARVSRPASARKVEGPRVSPRR